MSYSRMIATPLFALTMTFTLSACSTDSTNPSDSSDSEQQEASAEFNDADVEFTTAMIPHHQQAVVMSEMALNQGSPELVDLAGRIQAAQGPEIATMTQWLQDWGVDASTGMADMGDMPDMGMMEAGEMQDLMSEGGGQFDTAWLEMMIEHHEGAISMARAQQDEGLNPEAVDLAGTIIEDQQDEIVEMEQMLESDQ